MAHYSGQALYVEFAGVDCSADYRALDVSREYKIENTTAGADVDESHILLTRSAEFELTYLDETAAGTAIQRALYEGAQGTLVYGPQGTAAGLPKFSCSATVTSVSPGYNYDKAVERKVKLVKNGVWLDNYDISGDVFP